MTAADSLIPTMFNAETHDQSQWRIESLQMVNWGGFHGHTTVQFSPESTLVTGGSGSGKSTMLDAYIALMMPSDTPFNGASNEAAGRARSNEQRNLLSYLRGKTDVTVTDHSGTVQDKVLRGHGGAPVWGAVAGTFINDVDRRFTVLRLFFVRGDATTNGDVATTYATFDGPLDLKTMEPHAQQRFDKRRLHVAGLTTYKTYREFNDTICTKLGIGGGDGGRKALRLLARVQAGMKINRVDDLYKNMVLERPATYEVADTAIAHFADLEASYDKMLVEYEKAKVLEPLPRLQADLIQAREQDVLVNTIGTEPGSPSPFNLWSKQLLSDLLDREVDKNRADRQIESEKADSAREAERHYDSEITRIDEELRANGGDVLKARESRQMELERRRETVYKDRVAFESKIDCTKLAPIENLDDFTDAQKHATEFFEQYENRVTNLNKQHNQVEEERAPLRVRLRELKSEAESLKGRTGAVPRALHEARVTMAQAAGLDPQEDLPFVAELIDVRPEEQQWRTAIESTLGGVARTVLVDRNLREHLSRAIDPIRISPRIQFQAVDLADHQERRSDPEFISGKLVFKDCKFSEWVFNRVTGHGLDHRCVPTADDLHGDEPRVTLAGQTRSGDRGAHGRSSDHYIIGFSSKQRLAEIEAECKELGAKNEKFSEQVTRIQQEQGTLNNLHRAFDVLQTTRWEDIDVAGLDKEIEAVTSDIEKLRQNEPLIDQLATELQRAKKQKDEATNTRVLATDAVKKLDDEHGKLCDRKDRTTDELIKLETEHSVVLTEIQITLLDTLVAELPEPISLNTYGSDRAHVLNKLKNMSSESQTTIRNAVSSMEQMFSRYLDRWPNNNLGTSEASAGSFREILDRIQREGLHERRKQWRDELTSWSSDDLIQLSDAFDSAIEEIDNRLGPINRILKTFPFGGKGILQINPDFHVSEEQRLFRRDLRRLSSGLAEMMTDAQMEKRFQQLKAFMTSIKVPEGSGRAGSAKRDRLLDVRKQVTITAECVDENGDQVAFYDSLGGKSGGEIQELEAFIEGSALRYQLGDERRSRPRFAPVFLDEGFVKSDLEFTGRAIKAWQNFGFQLIVGTPIEKFGSIEPHMGLVTEAIKNQNGHSFIIDMPDEERESKRITTS